MKNPQQTSNGAQLTSDLNALGIYFILSANPTIATLSRQPTQLITDLAQSDEARLRLALIPVFLRHPEFAELLPTIAQALAPQARLNLQCYYTASIWLQQKYRTQLDALIGHLPDLPDYFSIELGIAVSGDFDDNLNNLAARHQTLSGMQINWLGTYHHAVKKWLRGLGIVYA